MEGYKTLVIGRTNCYKHFDSLKQLLSGTKRRVLIGQNNSHRRLAVYRQGRRPGYLPADPDSRFSPLEISSSRGELG